MKSTLLDWFSLFLEWFSLALASKFHSVWMVLMLFTLLKSNHFTLRIKRVLTLKSNYLQVKGEKVYFKSIPDTGTRVLANTRPFLHFSIISFWITPARSRERKYLIFRQYWNTKNIWDLKYTFSFWEFAKEKKKKKKKKKKKVLKNSKDTIFSVVNQKQKFLTGASQTLATPLGKPYRRIGSENTLQQFITAAVS